MYFHSEAQLFVNNAGDIQMRKQGWVEYIEISIIYESPLSILIRSICIFICLLFNQIHGQNATVWVRDLVISYKLCMASFFSFAFFFRKQLSRWDGRMYKGSYQGRGAPGHTCLIKLQINSRHTCFFASLTVRRASDRLHRNKTLTCFSDGKATG